MKLPAGYFDVAEVFRTYWHAYGGVSALVRSPYLHVAVLLLAITAHSWLSPGWWDTVVAVIPNLLGFTLGGFAIFIGFGDENFRRLMATVDEESSEPSPYLGLCSTFVHFVVVQALALAVAVIAKGLWFYAPWMDPVRPALPYLNAVGGAIGYGLFLYALMSVLAAAMHLFRIAGIYVTWADHVKGNGAGQLQSDRCSQLHSAPTAEHDERDPSAQDVRQ